jgi:transposase
VEEVDEQELHVERVAALDLGKAALEACVRVPHQTKPGRRLQEVRGYATTTSALLQLADWLHSWGVTRVVMESTSSYWKGPFWLLEAEGFECWLVNAREVKNVPGRPKTDKADAVWLCKVAERGMCRPSLVHPRPIRRLRDLTRYRRSLIHDRTREMQRVEKLLEDAGTKLSSVASDIFGVSGRAMLEALIAGQRDPKMLAQLAQRRLRAKRAALEEALSGFFTDHHGAILRMMLDNIDRHSEQVAALDTKVEEAIAPFAVQVAQLDAITGVGATAAQELIAEVGVDMGRFPSAAHLVSWAKFCPKFTSRPARGNPRAAARATRGWPGPWATSSPPPPAPTASWGRATGGSPSAAASRRRSWPPATRCWSSSTTYSPTPAPASSTWAATTTSPASTTTAGRAASPANSKPSPASGS